MKPVQAKLDALTSEEADGGEQDGRSVLFVPFVFLNLSNVFF
jgi:hypothetical protein